MQCDVTSNVKAMSMRFLTTLACKRTLALPYSILVENLLSPVMSMFVDSSLQFAPTHSV